MHHYSVIVAGSAKTANTRRFLAGIILFTVLCFLCPAGLYADDTVGRETRSWRIKTERWVEAEQIFHSDPCWLGGDGAVSVDLGGSRVLWLFGDSFVDLSGTGSRRSSTLVRNTIAVQTGYNPARASMQFAWNTEEGHPSSFFSKTGATWYWPASGFVLGRHLLIFLMEIRSADNDLGFEPCGWKAVWIDKVENTPDRWHLTWLVSPQQQGLVVGVGTPVLKNGFLQVLAVDGEGRSVYLVRWPEDAVRARTLTAPQWWSGEGAGWRLAPSGKEDLKPVFTDGLTEFSVAYTPRLQSYLRVQTGDLLNPCLAASTAPELAGPWSPHACFFFPPEQNDPELLIYAGRHHPMLVGADLVLSYVVNTTSVDRLLSDKRIYFPVMIKGRILANCSE